jgi:hypothetical protein
VLTFAGRSWLSLQFAAATSVACVAAGYALAHDEWKAPVALAAAAGAAALLLIGRMSVLALLAAAALYQGPLGNIGPMPAVTLAEIVTPAAVVVMLVVARRHEVRSDWHAIDKAVGVFAVVLAFNFVRSKYLLTTISNGVDRAFYDYAVAIGIYVATRITLKQRQLDTSHLVRLLYPLCAAAALAGLAIVWFHVPLNLGNLRYSVHPYSTGAVRAGFLEAFGAVGAAIVLTHPVRYRVAGLALFGAALVVSGGRAAAAGVAVAALVYAALVARKTVGAVSVGALVAAFVVPAAIWSWPLIHHQPQVERLASINASSFHGDGRGLIYSESFASFERHPAIGTGFGVRSYFVPSGDQAEIPGVVNFYREQLELGGHATYATLLKTFGLAGLVPFVAALMLALISAARARSRAGGFFFVLLGTQAIALIAGGDGNDPLYFFLLAACVAWCITRGDKMAEEGRA